VEALKLFFLFNKMRGCDCLKSYDVHAIGNHSFPQLPIAPSDCNASIFPISHHVSADHPCDHEINGQF